MGCECSSSSSDGNETLIMAASIALLAAGILLEIQGSMISIPFLFAAIVAAGYRIFPAAVRSVLRGHFTVHVLILIAVIGAIAWVTTLKQPGNSPVSDCRVPRGVRPQKIT